MFAISRGLEKIPKSLTPDNSPTQISSLSFDLPFYPLPPGHLRPFVNLSNHVSDSNQNSENLIFCRYHFGHTFKIWKMFSGDHPLNYFSSSPYTLPIYALLAYTEAWHLFYMTVFWTLIIILHLIFFSLIFWFKPHHHFLTLTSTARQALFDHPEL
jgi:hypothetical protein